MRKIPAIGLVTESFRFVVPAPAVRLHIDCHIPEEKHSWLFLLAGNSFVVGRFQAIILPFPYILFHVCHVAAKTASWLARFRWHAPALANVWQGEGNSFTWLPPTCTTQERRTATIHDTGPQYSSTCPACLTLLRSYNP